MHTEITGALMVLRLCLNTKKRAQIAHFSARSYFPNFSETGGGSSSFYLVQFCKRTPRNAPAHLQNIHGSQSNDDDSENFLNLTSIVQLVIVLCQKLIVPKIRIK
jgi:hypothetical protein